MHDGNARTTVNNVASAVKELTTSSSKSGRNGEHSMGIKLGIADGGSGTLAARSRSAFLQREQSDVIVFPVVETSGRARWVVSRVPVQAQTIRETVS